MRQHQFISCNKQLLSASFISLSIKKVLYIL